MVVVGAYAAEPARFRAYSLPFLPSLLFTKAVESGIGEEEGGGEDVYIHSTRGKNEDGRTSLPCHSRPIETTRSE